MAEPTLSLAFHDYLGEVGKYLGYGRGEDNDDPAWTTNQEGDITRAVAAGQRQFYTPPPLEGAKDSHEWSFLKPIMQVTLASGDSELILPDDFGGFDGPVTVTVSGSTTHTTLTFMGEGVVRQKHTESPDTTGLPQVVALVPVKGMEVNKGQRFKLSVWPTADAAYILKFRALINPDAMQGAKPYSYGGAQHVETVMASCLERAEFYKDNARGICYVNWMERLAASVSIDRRQRSVVVGMNRDMGVWDAGRGSGPDYWQTVTYV